MRAAHIMHKGISAVLSKIDSIDQHVEDTMEAGAGLCKEQVVKAVAKDSKKIIEWLLEQGVKFTKNNSGSSEKLHLTKEGGHTHPRIVHAADKTGEAIQESLIDKLKKKINYNLEKGLPENFEFDIINALDVLEHLENIHELFDEIFIKSKKKVSVKSYFRKLAKKVLTDF